mmetsp:Transcript_31595/g.5713  ORF Transcript_31595/g.5713 Transcript_31595/m.5713 type:complete len:112 (+) Transcript_31595:326-661(+)
MAGITIGVTCIFLILHIMKVAKINFNIQWVRFVVWIPAFLQILGLIVYGGAGKFGSFDSTNSRWIPNTMESGSHSHDYHPESGFVFAVYNATFTFIITFFWYLNVLKRIQN